jgi:Gpi18-like mannosyltransferase
LKKFIAPLFAVGAFIMINLPASWFGVPLSKIIDIYIGQAGYYPYLNLNAVNFWMWVPNDYFDFLNEPGVWLALAVIGAVLLGAFFRFQKNAKSSSAELLLLPTLLLLIAPFFLPQMHERYFFVAEVMALVLVFVLHKKYLIPVLILQFTAMTMYLKYLFNTQIPEQLIWLLPLLQFSVILYLVYQLFTNKIVQRGRRQSHDNHSDD